MKKILIPVLSLAICLSIVWKWTDGFSAFTIFTYTLNEAGNTPREFPDFKMIDQDSNVFDLKNKHKYVLINFVYLDCPYICHKISNRIDDIYHLSDKAIVPKKLEFVTVSFDPERDSIKKIRNYRSGFGSDINGWAFALPYQYNKQKFTRILRSIGVWTHQVPQTGMINHSLYLFLVSPENKIVRIFDPAREDDHTIIEQINTCIEKGISS